ncbi:MAG TPA: hypothetical protein GYA08_22070 [Chloroflexi bacterium]|nr:hypothetical protein [Chloroflexota bacterium]
MWAFFRMMMSAALTALAVPFYLRWSSAQAELQLEKMQKAVHFTPGAEAPLPPEVLAGAAGVTISHFAVGRLFGLRWWQAILSLLIGVVLGTGVFVYRMLGEEA